MTNLAPASGGSQGDVAISQLSKAILAIVLARFDPWAVADASALVELAGLAWSAVNTLGADCQFGYEHGASSSVCRPEAWTRDDWTMHEISCGHCALFLEARRRRR